MIKFILKFLVFIILIASSCVALYLLPTRYNHDLSIIINKLDLLKKSSAKKIIFVGGSGLLVGLESRLVRDKFNYDIVNIGTFANFGINFLLEETKPYLKNGDIVIISPEYGLLFGDGYFWPVEPHGVTWALAFSPYNSFKSIYSKRENFDKFPRDLSEILRDKLKALSSHLLKGHIKPILGRGRIEHDKIINEYGDQKIDNFPKLPPEQMEGHGIVFHDKITDSSKFSDLNAYNDYAKRNGAKVYLSFSCFPSEEYNQNKKQFDNIYQQLQNNLTFPVLGQPYDFVYPTQFFSNSINHLNQEGRILRTHKLIELLAKEIGKEK